MPVEEQAAYLLHSRKYTDTRIIVELLTLEYGRISAVFRKNNKRPTAMQTFAPLLVNWHGKSSLKTLTHVESQGYAVQLDSIALYCGFYLNEILMRSLPQEDSVEPIFHLYKKTIKSLAANDSAKVSLQLEQDLRLFEIALLEILGFGINFFEDVNQEIIEAKDDVFYRFNEGSGFVKDNSSSKNLFPASIIVAIRDSEMNDRTTLLYAKKLCRTALKNLVGDKPLKSRELFF